MQALSALPPDFISSPHCALMSVAQALAAVDSAKAEWVISRAAQSAAMQVKVLISDVLRLQCAHQRSGRKRRALGPRVLRPRRRRREWFSRSGKHREG